MEFTVASLMLDFAKAGILILIGHLLRSKIKFIQGLYIPSSLVAGVLGLILGPYFVNVLSFSPGASSYVDILMIFVFTGVGFGSFSAIKKKKDQKLKSERKDKAKRIVSLFNYRSIAAILVYIVPVFTAVYVINKFIMKLPEGFGILVGGGFVGGHGTNSGFASAVTEITGWEGATDIGMTFATVGLLVGLIGGIIMIKIATNKGQTSFVEKFSEMPLEYKTGFMEEDATEDLGKQIVSPIALDPLAWSFILMLIPVGGALFLSPYIKSVIPTIPTYLVAFLISIVIVMIFKYTNKGHLLDKKSLSRISGTATDFLVFFGVARLNVSVVVEFAVPIIILSALALIMLLLCTYLLGPRMNETNWFERCIFVYGYCTGVYAIGITLLRMVDPEAKSNTLEDIAVTAPIDFVEYYVLIMGPALVASGKSLTFILTMLIFGIACLVVQTVFKLWNKPAPSRLEAQDH